jgi:hypothetical protein
MMSEAFDDCSNIGGIGEKKVAAFGGMGNSLMMPVKTNFRSIKTVSGKQVAVQDQEKRRKVHLAFLFSSPLVMETS